MATPVLCDGLCLECAFCACIYVAAWVSMHVLQFVLYAACLHVPCAKCVLYGWVQCVLCVLEESGSAGCESVSFSKLCMHACTACHWLFIEPLFCVCVGDSECLEPHVIWPLSYKSTQWRCTSGNALAIVLPLPILDKVRLIDMEDLERKLQKFN